MYEARDAVEVKEEKASKELKKLHLAHSEPWTQTRDDHEVLQQVEKIVVGKPYLLHCVFGSKGFIELIQLWCSTEVFADLQRSASDATHHFGEREGHEAEKAFW